MKYKEIMAKHDELAERCTASLAAFENGELEAEEVLNAQMAYLVFCARFPSETQNKDVYTPTRYPQGGLEGRNGQYIKARIARVENALKLWEAKLGSLGPSQLKLLKFSKMAVKDVEAIMALMPYERVRLFARRSSKSEGGEAGLHTWVLQTSAGDSYPINLLFRDRCREIVEAGPYTPGCYPIEGDIITMTGKDYIYLGGGGRIRLASIWPVFEKFAHFARRS